jgi:hypothetical protein
LFSRLLRAAAAFAVVLAAYVAYAVVAVPWMEPGLAHRPGGALSSNEPASETHHQARRRVLESLFPADAWELTDDRVKVLETDYGMLLLLDYRTREGGQLEIQPCTMVLEAPSSDASRPPRYVALQAPQGATLQFDREIDLRRAEIGRPTGGRLNGEVRVFSPPTRPGADDVLEVITENVQIDAGRAWTPHQVSFRFGRSYGRGRGLTVELLSRKDGKPRASRVFEAAGVRLLELSHVEELHLEAPPEDLFSDLSADGHADSARPALDRAALEAPLEVACQGPFRFDFEEMVASVQDDVEVRRLHAQGQTDQLNCRLLEIYFATPGAHLSSEATEESDKATSRARKSLVRRLVAVGQPVLVRAPSVGAFVQGDRLEYDVQSRRLRLEKMQPLLLDGAERGTSPGGRNAVLQHQGRHLEAPRLQYDLGVGRRLGKLWAAGPGVFRGPLPENSNSFAELPPDATFEIAWRGEIHLRPHEGLHVASITGGATARIGEVGGFDTGELHVWLRETAEERRPDAPPQQEPRYRILPDRLLAQRGVHFHSPRWSGAAGKLEVWFEDAPPLPENQTPQNQWAEDASARNAARKQAFDLRGDLLQLRILRRGRKTMLEDAAFRGNVLVRETQTERPDEAPLMIAGDLVELHGGSGPQAQLVVLGDPSRSIRARAGARGVSFSGWQLHVDQGANRVWIDGPGELVLPAPRSKTRLPSPRGPSLPSLTSLTVAWRKGLNFDGGRVVVEDNVETRGDGQVIRSDSLQAFLARPIHLAHPEQFENAEVARLLFGGRPEDPSGVTLENRTVENGDLTAFDRGHTRNLDIDLIAGRLNAAGPGWIESVRRGGIELAAPGVATVASTASARTPNAEPTTPSAPGLTFVRVDFHEAIAGQAFSQDLSQWKLTFLQDVETIVGPVNRWEERLNADSPAGLGPRGMLLLSRELSVTQMGVSPQGEPPLELAATGRPHIESWNFHADGDRLSYDAAKGLLVLEGGREEARFWHRQNGGLEIDGSAQRVQYWPQENRLDADVRFLDFDLNRIRNAIVPGRSKR